MNKTLAVNIRQRVLAALKQEFGEEYTVAYVGGSFGQTSFQIKLEVAEQSPDGHALTRNMGALKRMAAVWAGGRPVIRFRHGWQGDPLYRLFIQGAQTALGIHRCPHRRNVRLRHKIRQVRREPG